LAAKSGTKAALTAEATPEATKAALTAEATPEATKAALTAEATPEATKAALTAEATTETHCRSPSCRVRARRCDGSMLGGGAAHDITETRHLWGRVSGGACGYADYGNPEYPHNRSAVGLTMVMPSLLTGDFFTPKAQRAQRDAKVWRVGPVLCGQPSP